MQAQGARQPDRQRPGRRRPTLPVIYRNQAVLANNAGNKAKAEAAFAKVVELSPNDPEALINLAQVKNDLKKPDEAVQLHLPGDRDQARRRPAGRRELVQICAEDGLRRPPESGAPRGLAEAQPRARRRLSDQGELARSLCSSSATPTISTRPPSSTCFASCGRAARWPASATGTTSPTASTRRAITPRPRRCSTTAPPSG